MVGVLLGEIHKGKAILCADDGLVGIERIDIFEIFYHVVSKIGCLVPILVVYSFQDAIGYIPYSACAVLLDVAVGTVPIELLLQLGGWFNGILNGIIFKQSLSRGDDDAVVDACHVYIVASWQQFVVVALLAQNLSELGVEADAP